MTYLQFLEAQQEHQTIITCRMPSEIEARARWDCLNRSYHYQCTISVGIRSDEEKERTKRKKTMKNGACNIQLRCFDRGQISRVSVPGFSLKCPSEENKRRQTQFETVTIERLILPLFDNA